MNCYYFKIQSIGKKNQHHRKPLKLPRIALYLNKTGCPAGLPQPFLATLSPLLPTNSTTHHRQKHSFLALELLSQYCHLFILSTIWLDDYWYKNWSKVISHDLTKWLQTIPEPFVKEHTFLLGLLILNWDLLCKLRMYCTLTIVYMDQSFLSGQNSVEN